MSLEKYIQDLIENEPVAKGRKEKYDDLINTLLDMQPFDGAQILIPQDPAFYAKLYFQSYEEMNVFLREMHHQNVVRHIESEHKVQFTFAWLDQRQTATQDKVMSKEGGNGFEPTDLPLSCFICYAHTDGSYKSQLVSHLAVLERNGVLKLWHDGEITPSSLWNSEIALALIRAKIIVVFVSSDFFNSQYTYEQEFLAAMHRHLNGRAIIIPVIVRPCYFQSSKLGSIQALPSNAKPITKWDDTDDAYNDIVRGIDQAIQKRMARQA